MRSAKLISVVVPVYNEQSNLKHFYQALKKVIDKHRLPTEIIFVNDGSSDTSESLLKDLANKDVRLKILSFTRNFGKEVAITAGLHQARGQVCLIIDGDGQHPVEKLPDFLKLWKTGAQVVIGLRRSNQQEGWLKRNGSRLYYFVLRRVLRKKVLRGLTDFRLLDRQVVEAFRAMPEHNRMSRFIIDWLGFKTAYVEFAAGPRESGQASYSFRKLMQLAVAGFISHSFLPLHLAGYLGLFITPLAFMLGLVIIVEMYILNDPLNWSISGTGILGLAVVFLVGVLLATQGLISLYIESIYTETKQRPLYVIKEVYQRSTHK